MGILPYRRGVSRQRVNHLSNIYKYTLHMGINKKMPVQEIGLYRMAKEAKALHERKEMVEEAMTMANAVSIAESMTAHKMIFKKKK